VRNDCEVAIFDQQDSSEDLGNGCWEADIVFHLAGINRPENPSDFESGNIALTEQICQILIEGGRIPRSFSVRRFRRNWTTLRKEQRQGRKARCANSLSELAGLCGSTG